MPESPNEALSETRSNRLWSAIIRLDVAAHDADQSEHTPDETIWVSYLNGVGNRITQTLEYRPDAEGVFAPRIQTEVETPWHTFMETILWVSDSTALIAESRQCANGDHLAQMAVRASAMYKQLKRRDQDPQTKWKIPGAYKKKNAA